jgi:putative transposase
MTGAAARQAGGSAPRTRLAFVTKYRRGVPAADTLRCRQDATRKAGGDPGAKPREFNGEDDHAHLLAQYPPTANSAG